MPFDGEVLEGEVLSGEEQCIHVTIIYNTLDPSDRETVQLAWEPGKTLARYLDGLPTDDGL